MEKTTTISVMIPLTLKMIGPLIKVHSSSQERCFEVVFSLENYDGNGVIIMTDNTIHLVEEEGSVTSTN